MVPASSSVFPVLKAGIISAFKLLCHLSSHPAAFGFQVSLPPDIITLNPANKRMNWSLSDFQTGIGAAVHATLDIEYLMSHTRTILVDTIASLKDSDGSVIADLEVHELLNLIHDILDNAVYKWVGSTAHILAYLFNSASRQHHEIWATLFPFLHNIKDSIPLSEACLYGHINSSLAQAYHQSSLRLSQSSPSMKGIRDKSRAGCQFNVQKQPVPE